MRIKRLNRAIQSEGKQLGNFPAHYEHGMFHDEISGNTYDYLAFEYLPISLDQIMRNPHKDI